MTPRERTLISAATMFVSVLFAGAVLYILQFSHAYVTETDPLYHIGATQLLKERGIERSFEWAQLSIWKDRYSDKEFLLHLLMAPFVSDDVDASIKGGKIFVVLLGAAVLGVFAWMMRSHQIPLSAVWVIVLVAASAHWLVRMTILRGHVLSILLALLSIHFLLKGNWKALAAVGFAYAWGYSAPQIILILGVAVTVVRRIHQGAWEWKPLAGAAAGFLAGMIVNPYFPNNIAIFWIQNVDVPLAGWGLSGPPIELGKELSAHVSRDLLLVSPLMFLLFFAANVAPAAMGKTIGWEALSVLSIAWLFFLLYLLSWKFVEYFAPMTVLAAALVARDVRPENTKPIPIAIGALVILLALWRTYSLADLSMQHAVYAQWEPSASKWIKAHVPKGETILHLSFDQFAPLFLRDRDHRYLVALDPMFAFAAHPEEMRYLERLRTFREKADPKDMAQKLGGRFLIVWRQAHERVAVDLEAAGAKRVYQDPTACVLQLK